MEQINSFRPLSPERIQVLWGAMSPTLPPALSSALDTILDLTVVPGYTSIGYRLRRPMWDAAELPPMDGRVVLITGATSGLGLAAAESFARLRASVIIVGRNAERGERARSVVTQRTGNPDVTLELCDLSSLESVRALATRMAAAHPRLDVLVNNAGVLPPERTLSVDGVELTFATNVLGPFLLTELLVPLLQRAAPGRVINVSSGGMYSQRLDVDDLENHQEPFDGVKAYARSKRAEVILTELWAQRLQGDGIVVHAMHPGWADTPGVESSLPRFHTVAKKLLRTPEQGADTIVWLGAAAEPAASSGGFWHDRRRRGTHRVPWTRESPEDRQRLWAECERLSGLKR
jgi:dehydrogenase/reductase SDR family protein 12